MEQSEDVLSPTLTQFFALLLHPPAFYFAPLFNYYAFIPSKPLPFSSLPSLFQEHGLNCPEIWFQCYIFCSLQCFVCCQCGIECYVCDTRHPLLKSKQKTLSKKYVFQRMLCVTLISIWFAFSSEINCTPSTSDLLFYDIRNVIIKLFFSSHHPPSVLPFYSAHKAPTCSFHFFFLSSRLFQCPHRLIDYGGVKPFFLTSNGLEKNPDKKNT